MKRRRKTDDAVGCEVATSLLLLPPLCGEGVAACHSTPSGGRIGGTSGLFRLLGYGLRIGEKLFFFIGLSFSVARAWGL